ncbi:hypothetical protein GCM10020295_00310 [Streptomyces cinereospinus]
MFWPVGTGDSTTIVLGGDLVVQVDLRDMKAADEDDAVVAAVIDRLEETLPQPDGKTPYLAVFALTHADKDHCCGFGDPAGELHPDRGRSGRRPGCGASCPRTSPCARTPAASKRRSNGV